VWSKDGFVFLDFFGDMDQKSHVENYSMERDFKRGFSEDELREAIEDLMDRGRRFGAVAFNSGIENRPGLLEWLKRKGLLILGNDPEILRRARSPEIILPMAVRHGACIPRTFYVTRDYRFKEIPASPSGRHSELPEYQRARFLDTYSAPGRCPLHTEERSWLLKPTFTAGGSGIRFLKTKDLRESLQKGRAGEKLQLIESGMSPIKDSGSSESPAVPFIGAMKTDDGASPGSAFPRYVVQEFISGMSCSVVFIADGRRSQMIGVSRQLTGDEMLGSGGFSYCGNIMPLDGAMSPQGFHGRGCSTKALYEALDRLVHGLTVELGLMGLNCIDFILRDDKIWFLEINPRYSASMELLEIFSDSFHPGYLSLADIHFKAVTGKLGDSDYLFSREKFEWARSIEKMKPLVAGKAIVYAENDVRIPDSLPKIWLNQGVKDVPFPGDVIPKGSPICTLLASSTSEWHTPRTTCLDKLYMEASRIRRELSNAGGGQ
jgi:predicted ATP-grasp superfamily ATP-dependent carboligase